MTKITHEFELYGKSYRLETGELAKQATGAVVVSQGRHYLAHNGCCVQGASRS